MKRTIWKTSFDDWNSNSLLFKWRCFFKSVSNTVSGPKRNEKFLLKNFVRTRAIICVGVRNKFVSSFARCRNCLSLSLAFFMNANSKPQFRVSEFQFLDIHKKSEQYFGQLTPTYPDFFLYCSGTMMMDVKITGQFRENI